MRRKFLSVLLSLSMVLTMVPSIAIAETTSADNGVQFAAPREGVEAATSATVEGTITGVVGEAFDNGEITVTLGGGAQADPWSFSVSGAVASNFTVVGADGETAVNWIDVSSVAHSGNAQAATANSVTLSLAGNANNVTEMSGTIKVLIEAAAFHNYAADTVAEGGSWSITDAAVITMPTDAEKTVKAGESTEFTMAATSQGTYTYSLNSGAPSWVTIDEATGMVTIAPPASTAATTSPIVVTVTATDGEASATAQISITVTAADAEPDELTLTANKSSVTVKGGESDEVQMTAAGGNGVYTYSISPELDWITIDANGKVTIAPTASTASGNTTVTITVTDSDGSSKTATISVTVTASATVDPETGASATIDSASLTGNVNVDFNGTINLTVEGPDLTEAGSSVNGYVVNTPDGVSLTEVSVTKKTETTSSSSVVLKISGKPTAECTDAVSVSIKAAAITGGSVDIVAVNENGVKWNFTEATTPVEPEELTFKNVSIPEGRVGTAITEIDLTQSVEGGTGEYTFAWEGDAHEWVKLSTDGILSGTRPSAAKAATTATIKVTDSDNATATATLTVGRVTTSSGSSSSGGSGGGGGGSSTVTSPASKNDGVEIEARVSGNTITVENVDTENISGSTITLDLTSIRDSVRTVKFAFSAIRDLRNAVKDNDGVDSIAFKMNAGTVEFDEEALNAIISQANGNDVQFDFESVGTTRLNNVQKQAISGMEIHGGLRITMNGGSAIVDFKGGTVSISIPFTVPSGKNSDGFSVFHVSSTGELTKMATRYSGGFLNFTTTHFSDYLIAYEEVATTEPAPETCTGGSNCPSFKFADVDTNAWYHLAVDFVITNGLMNGISGSEFAPNANLSRAMLAQILYNKEGTPSVSGTADFTDVPEGMWYTNAVAWASANGIVSGYGNGQFGPNDNITREQLAVMLYRYAGSPSASGSVNSFVDSAEISDYAVNAMVWATSNGIMSGKGANNLDPKGLATRAEVAQMLKSYLDK